jgi:hypothetical protein
MIDTAGGKPHCAPQNIDDTTIGLCPNKTAPLTAASMAPSGVMICFSGYFVLTACWNKYERDRNLSN